MVEVFKTSVSHRSEADRLLSILRSDFPMFRINFDLTDCDNILRVEGLEIDPDVLIQLLENVGYSCTPLD